MKIAFVADLGSPQALALVVGEGRKLCDGGKALDTQTGGAFSRAMQSGRFTGGKGKTLVVTAPHGLDASVVVLAGLGDRESLTDLAIEEAVGAAYHAVKMSGAESLTVDARSLSAEQAARVAFAIKLAAYRFDKYLTRQKPEKVPSVTALNIVSADAKAAESAFGPMSAVADGVIFARDLVSEPANVLYPEEFAKRCKALESLGLEVEVLGEKELEKLGFRTLLAVGMGSRRDSQVALMKWNGGKSGDAPLAFVGKGVVFDTGGISLKPGLNMEDMKGDMGGAAAVTGLMHTLAARKARANVIGVIGLVENMPHGNAQRPGDIVTSMSGQTIEILNTDAKLYGGSNIGNQGAVNTETVESHGHPYSLQIPPPPLAAVIFKPILTRSLIWPGRSRRP